jgi:hypothetical protein
MWGAWRGAQAALSTGSGSTPAGSGGRCVRTWSALNRIGRVADKWTRGHSNGLRRFELDPNANSNEFKQV